uniref:Uncharacterized protein n=1 Tax=Piliocolobus tephrosceles TaxID=591936 RepID=A0A8C9I7C6_9PRIM
MAMFALNRGESLSLLNQILLHYYTSTLFIWEWAGSDSSLVVQLPDYGPILLEAHFCQGVVCTAVFGTFNFWVSVTLC